MSSTLACSKRAEGTVVLVSGGVDSTVLLYQLSERSRADGAGLFPLFVGYAQRAMQREREAAAWHCSELGLTLRSLDIASVGETFREVQTVNLHIPVPHRNLVVLGLALSYVEVVGATSVALGVIRDDIDGYPSASLAFLRVFRELAQSLGPVRVETPLLEWQKSSVVTEGLRLGVDFERTYSCMLGREQHCGRCGQCERRNSALASR